MTNVNYASPRAKRTVDLLSENVRRAGLARRDYELLIGYNSFIPSWVELELDNKRPEVFLKSPAELGYAKMDNQLLLRAKGELIIETADDFLLQDEWMYLIYKRYFEIPNLGIMGVNFERVDQGQTMADCIYTVGPHIFARYIIDAIGYKYEGYPEYGYEDLDYCYRAWKAGYENKIATDIVAEHQMIETPEQREWKNKFAQSNAHAYRERVQLYNDHPTSLAVSAPEKIDLWPKWKDYSEQVSSITERYNKVNSR